MTQTDRPALSLFLGCVMPNRFPNVEKSIREVLPRLGIHFTELEGASCCPAPGVIRSFDTSTWLALASRNLALAEKKGTAVLTGCNGCYGTFKEALAELAAHPDRLREVQDIFKSLGMKFSGTTDVKHVIEVIYELGVDSLRPKIVHPLKDIRVAVHYGCHLLKPSKNRPWKQTQRHTFLDELVEVTGATSVKYKDKYMCCGAGGGVRGSNTPVSIDIAREKIDNMIDAGADLIVNVCSFCHLQFEMSQPQLNKEIGENRYQLPVLYYTQFLGLAMGMDPGQLGLTKHVVDTQPLLDRLTG